MYKLASIKKFTDKYFVIILFVFLASFIIFCLIGSTIETKNMLKRPKFTIAIATTDWHHKNNNGVGTDYMYKLDGVTFRRTTSDSYKKGDKFLIIYDSLKPEKSQGLPLYSVKQDYIGLKIPENGWKYVEVPFKIDSNIIRKYLNDWNVEPYEYD